jgi:hypothetical protein
VKRIATLAALAAAATLAACSYNEDAGYVGPGATAPYGSQEMPPPLSYHPAHPPAYSTYSRVYSVPLADPAPSEAAPAACYRPAHYDRWGYWVPARYVC